MRLKVILLIALIAAWTILNTGTYAYLTNIRGFDPSSMNPILALASLAIGSVLIMAIGATHKFDRASWRWNTGPFVIALLGITFWQGMPPILAMVLLGLGTWMAVHLLEDDNVPISMVHMFAVNTALSGALMPALGWRLEGALDDAISFWLPFVPTVGAFAIAFWASSRPHHHSFETPTHRSV